MSASTSHTTAFRKRLARIFPITVDAARMIRHPRWEIEIWQDYLRTRRAARPLRRLEVDDVAPALVALYRDNVFETKLAMVGGTALRLDGMPVIVAVPGSRDTRSRRYAKALGADRVVDQERIDDELTESDDNERAQAVAVVLALGPDVAAVRQWTFDGHQAGMHILSSLIRLTFDGSPDLAAHQDLLRPVADDTIRQYQRATVLLDRFQPGLVLVQEANYAFNGPLVDLATARGIDVIQTITTWRDDAFMSKRLTAATRRVDAKSVDLSTLERLERDDPWTDRHDRELDEDFDARYGGRWKLGGQFQPNTRDFDREELLTLLSIDPNKPTVVVFAHVLWDASLFFGHDLFANYSEWFTETVRAAIANDRVNWVIKAHPANVFRQSHGDAGGEAAEVVLLREIAPDPPEHVRILLPDTLVSTVSLYRFADAAVTVRGTPGLEMACFGKPVFTAGTGSYSGLGFTVDSASRDDYLARLAALPDGLETASETVARARRYAHALFLDRLWRPDGFGLRIEFPEQGWHPIDHNIEITPDVVAERRSLDAWTEWARRSTSTDFPPG